MQLDQLIRAAQDAAHHDRAHHLTPDATIGTSAGQTYRRWQLRAMEYCTGAEDITPANVQEAVTLYGVVYTLTHAIPPEAQPCPPTP